MSQIKVRSQRRNDAMFIWFPSFAWLLGVAANETDAEVTEEAALQRTAICGPIR